MTQGCGNPWNGIASQSTLGSIRRDKRQCNPITEQPTFSNTFKARRINNPLRSLERKAKMKLWSQRNGAAFEEQLPLSDRMRSEEAFLRGETHVLSPAITNDSFRLLTAFPHLHRTYWRAYLICKALCEAYSSYSPPLLKHDVSFIHLYYALQSYHIISFKPFAPPRHWLNSLVPLNQSLFYFLFWFRSPAKSHHGFILMLQWTWNILKAGLYRIPPLLWFLHSSQPLFHDAC